MAENIIATYSAVLYSAATVTANGNSATFNLPQGDSYAFIADVGTITGTSPTFDISIQGSPDGGTTWYTFWRFAQFTAAAVRRLVVQPMQGRGEAGTEAAIGTTGALNANCPFPALSSATARINILVGGTSPSAATIKVWIVAAPRQTTV